MSKGEDILGEDSYRSALDRAVRLLSRRNHTALEIEHKLIRRGFTRETAASVIQECERLRYIDDHETARSYFRELKRKGEGPVRIRARMKQKGLSGEWVESMLFQYTGDAEEIENARKALKKKKPRFDREPDPRKRKEKMYRFLYSRGFSGAVISAVIRERK